MADIGFIGLGNMGGPMARNLARAGHNVRCFDLVEQAVAATVEAGATAAPDPAAAAEGVSTLFSMLPAGQHVEAVWLGQDDAGRCLLDRVAPGTLLVDCSTIAPDTARKVAAAAAERGLTMLDAPVSGGTAGAEAGTLSFIVGGPAAGLEAARPLLEVMGANIFHAGDAGAGQVAKVCNNMLLAIHMTGTAEALALGVANGLDPAVLSEVMKQSSGGNWSLNVYNPWPGVMDGVPASRDYSGGFLTDLMLKDLGLAMEAADKVGQSTPMGTLARSLYQLHRARNGAGQLDFSSIQRLFADC